MPDITLVEAPSPGARAVDYVSGTSLALGESATVDEETVARLRSVEPIGYRFKVSGGPAVGALPENAPAPAGEPFPPAVLPAPTDAPVAQ